LEKSKEKREQREHREKRAKREKNEHVFNPKFKQTSSFSITFFQI